MKRFLSEKKKSEESLLENITKFGDMPRATDDPPIVYSRIKAQPISQATLPIICQQEIQKKR